MARALPDCGSGGARSWSDWALPEPIEYLVLEDLLALVRLLAVGPVRDVGLLHSAAARARSSTFGHDAYPTLALKAAALLESVTRHHALVDGNKRLAWLATVIFLDLSGHDSALTNDEAFQLVMDVAAGHVDVVVVSARLCVVRR